MVVFADYVHDKPLGAAAMMPGREKGEWKYLNLKDRRVDREGFEKFKTLFYKREGWDVATGRPTRRTLADLGLCKAADELEEQGKLGKES